MTDDQAVVCVVSDHGTLDNRYNIRPNVKREGSRAYHYRWERQGDGLEGLVPARGGMSEIRLKNGQDEDARRKLDQIMKELSSDPVFWNPGGVGPGAGHREGRFPTG